jgi:excisionase family DNA binding protein
MGLPNMLHHFLIPDELLAELAVGKSGEVLTLAEAAAFLRIDEQDVLRMVKEQALPGRQVGQEWRFLKAAIRDWLRAGTPRQPSKKDAQLAVVGSWKGDPYTEELLEGVYRKRGRAMTEDSE